MTSNHDNKLSLSELQSLADQGDMQAQFALGLYYLQSVEWEFIENLRANCLLASLSTEKSGEFDRYRYIDYVLELPKDNNKTNDKLAFDWFHRAAKQGYAESQYAVAYCYFEEKGIEKNDKLAFEWAKKSAVHGISYAFCLLGDLYHDGHGVEANDKEALKYYKRALDGGLSNAYTKWIKMILMAKGVVDYEEVKDVVEDFERKIIQHINDKIEACKKHRFYGQDTFEFEEALNVIKNITKFQSREIKKLSLAVTEYKQEMENAQEKLRELVQNTSHLAGNLLRPNTQEKIAKRLKNTEFTDESKKLYYASSDIRYVKQQFKLLEIMQSLTGSEAIRSQIKLDEVDNCSNQSMSIEDILNLAAFRAIDKFFDTNEYSLNFARDTIGKKQGDFLRLSSEYQKYVLATVDDENLSILSWCSENLRPITICYKCDDWKKILFHNNSQSVALFFCYFFELLFNAFKYADHNEHDFLTITLGNEVISGNEFLTMIWTNPKSNQSSFGSNKGLNLSASYISLLNDDKYKEKSQEVISRNDNTFELITRIDRIIFNL